MTRRFRTFLLCLLMAALPLQGLAAVLQAACGPAHHDLAAQAGQVHQESVQAHGHGHDLGHIHAMESTLQQDLPDDAAGSASTCSACAVCSASAVALPSAAAPGFADFAPGLALAAPTPLLSGVVPAGLERPPKTASI